MSIDTQSGVSTLHLQVARMIRERLGAEELTRAELARRLDVHETWVGKRLKGRTEITLDDLDRIASALGVTIVDLLPRDRREVTVTSDQPSSPVDPHVVRRGMNRPTGGHPPGRSDRHGPPSGPRRTSRVPGSLTA